MVRKTREEALATRGRILDAAEQLFQARGVSNASLHHIAEAAGVTRGAVYWHFKDKGDLIQAMLGRVCLPMDEAAAAARSPDRSAPLQTLRAHLLGVLERVAGDERVRRVFEIVTQKAEFVDELAGVRELRLKMRREHLAALERLLRAAQARGHIGRSPPAREIAIGLQALLDGLIQGWMFDPEAFALRTVGARVLDRHLAGLGASG